MLREKKFELARRNLRSLYPHPHPIPFDIFAAYTPYVELLRNGQIDHDTKFEIAFDIDIVLQNLGYEYVPIKKSRAEAHVENLILNVSVWPAHARQELLLLYNSFSAIRDKYCPQSISIWEKACVFLTYDDYARHVANPPKPYTEHAGQYNGCVGYSMNVTYYTDAFLPKEERFITESVYCRE